LFLSHFPVRVTNTEVYQLERTGFCSVAEQTIELLLGNALALARAADQPAAIDDRDIAAFVADEAGPLQSARRSRNAGPLYPQHHSQELLRRTAPLA
jgi:hypothetical protein